MIRARRRYDSAPRVACGVQRAVRRGQTHVRVELPRSAERDDLRVRRKAFPRLATALPA